MTQDPAPTSSLPSAALAARWNGELIDAIKLVRQDRNMGLKDAKDALDAYMRTQPELQRRGAAVQAEQIRRFVHWTAALAVLLALAAYWFWIRSS